MDKPSTDKKVAKIRADIEQLTGISFSGDAGDLAELMAIGVHDAIRTGTRRVNPDVEDSPIHCNAEWHFARFTGPGATLVPLLYGISFHLAAKSGCFFLSMTKLAAFLNKKKADELYYAADLLVASGFWQVVEAEVGKPVKYRPVGHTEWAAQRSGTDEFGRPVSHCTKMLELDFPQDDEALALLGRNLYAIFGGEKFVPGVLIGIRNAANGLTDEQICEHAKQFMADDSMLMRGSGKERRKRFIKYLGSLEGSEGTAI